MFFCLCFIQEFIAKEKIKEFKIFLYVIKKNFLDIFIKKLMTYLKKGYKNQTKNDLIFFSILSVMNDKRKKTGIFDIFSSN